VAIQDKDEEALRQLSNASVPDHGWTVTVQENGVFDVVSGIIPDQWAINSYESWLLLVTNNGTAHMEEYQPYFEVLGSMKQQYEKEQEGLTGLPTVGVDLPKWFPH